MCRRLAKEDRCRIDRAVEHFADNRHLFTMFVESLVPYFVNHPELGRLIHFIKYRIKDEDSLRAKLERLTVSTGPEPMNEPVSESNLFERISDLVGLRIIHLHTDQLVNIHPLILEILGEQRLVMAGSPTAYYWDVEFQELFKNIGLKTELRGSMYTTVHYDIVANQRTEIRCEVQVRSLMDEVWGEISHRINYPMESPSATCQDQLKVLARLTSGCGRLVDSIFKTHHEAQAPQRNEE